MTELAKVSYCGLYCGLCTTCNRLPQRAQALQETMRNDGWEHWGGEIPNFKAFWDFLSGLSASGESQSCRNENCGAPFCTIRKCAREKGVTVCALCADFPCRRIEGLAQGYGLLKADAARIREIGLEKWIAEQEERKKNGFCYADIRCHPYTVPND